MFEPLLSTPLNTVHSYSIPKLSELQPISEETLAKVIKSGNSKHCQLYPILTAILKEVLVEVLPILTRIVSSSMSSSVFPDNSTAATVIAFLKKSTLDKEDFKNYRPVSTRLIKRIAVEQLNEHLSIIRLYNPCQSA